MEYPEDYSIECIPKKINMYRHVLKITTKAKGISALLVLLSNPDIVNEKEDNKKINSLIKNFGTKYRQIIVVGILPIVATSKIDLNKKINNIRGDIGPIIERNIIIVDDVSFNLKYFDLLVATGKINSKLNRYSYIELMNVISLNQKVGEIYAPCILKSKYSGILYRKPLGELQEPIRIVKKDVQWHLKER